MLFNSPEFLLAFLPITLLGFFLIATGKRATLAIAWLVAASLFFYGWWNPKFLAPLLASIVFNFLVGLWLDKRPNRWVLAFGVGGNLAGLGWFKYSGFLAELINDVSGLGIPVPHVILPLAISFHTFQQIAYLVDVNGGHARERSFARYLLFVVFFPQLIAGPIVHHKEMLEQFGRPDIYRPRLTNLVLGLAVFTIGLFKKVLLADPLASLTPMAFGPAGEGLAPGFVDAWLGAIAFALQLYFDFSGYSDMAIGLALMFGIRLPINFSSPFKSASIIEFWQRWHMTLTRFLTNYLYNPIVMSMTRRRVKAGKLLLRRAHPKLEPFLVLVAFPTFITMFLAGVWHGAGWQFVVFGLLHGTYLVGNHAWRALRPTLGLRGGFGMAGHAAGVVVTFLLVTISLVFFKAASLDQAVNVVQGMAGIGGEFRPIPRLGAPDYAAAGPLLELIYRLLSTQGALLIGGLIICWTLPNTAEYLDHLTGPVKRRAARAKAIVLWSHLRERVPAFLRMTANPAQGAVIGIFLGLALLRALSVAPTEFLYFTF